jgi:hypothetical protein
MDPSLYWAYQESSKPAGYELPAAYQGAEWEADKADTLALYASHFKSDPLAEVRELCTDGAGDIVV